MRAGAEDQDASSASAPLLGGSARSSTGASRSPFAFMGAAPPPRDALCKTLAGSKELLGAHNLVSCLFAKRSLVLERFRSEEAGAGALRYVLVNTRTGSWLGEYPKQQGSTHGCSDH